MGFIKNERSITKKSGAEYLTRVQADMQYLYISPESPLYCDNCKARLGMLRTLRSSVGVSQGAEYCVICPKCRRKNWRIKGALAKEVNKRWLENES